jgi:hypothetical protein
MPMSAAASATLCCFQYTWCRTWRWSSDNPLRALCTATAAATRSAWSGAAPALPETIVASETSLHPGLRGAEPVVDEVAGHGQQPTPDIAGALGEDLRVAPGPQEGLLGDVRGAVAVLQQPSGVGHHGLAVFVVHGPENGLVSRLVMRPARSGIDRAL